MSTETNINNNNSQAANNTTSDKLFKDFDKNVNKINIPEEMKKLNNWVCWKYEEVKGRKTKIPYQVNGHHASASDSKTWNTFIQVMSIVSEFDGIGFVFSKESSDIMGVDFDHVYENGVWNEEVLQEIKSLGSYAELSPSGTGAHVIVRGRINGDRNRIGNHEIYNDKRFFTVTGNHIAETPLVVNQAQEALDNLYNKLFSEKTDKINNIQKSEISVSDGKVIEIAGKAKNGEKFTALYQGNWNNLYTSQSEADLAFCGMLAFYTQDAAQIDNIFRSSMLYREKWNRPDYRDRVINTAISGLTAKFDWNRNNNEVVVEIPEHSFKFVITYDGQYKIKIPNYSLPKSFSEKSFFNVSDNSRNNELFKFLTIYGEVEKEKTDQIILEFNKKIGSEELYKQLNSLRFKESKGNKEQRPESEGAKYLDMNIPYPFIIKNDTLYVEKLMGKGEDAEYVQSMVSRAFAIKSIGEIKDKGDFESIRYVELAWIDIDGNEKSDLFQTNYVLEPSLQKEYLKHLDIAGNKRTDIIDYYQKLLMNNEISIKEITKVGGWKDNFTRYVTDDETYGSNCKYMLLENQSMENIHQKGSFDRWIEGVYELINDPVFGFINYTGVCALIQRYLGIPNFNILFINLSSIGKTTGGKERSSMFGNPHHMMITSNASKQGIPNTVYAYNDVPCHVDEIKNEDIPMVRKLFYDISSGQKRIVATKNGGTKNTKYETYAMNVLYTSEEQILDDSSKMGQLARTIPILRTPKNNPAAVKKFEDLVCSKNGSCNNYGHCVELLVPKIINMIQDGSLKTRFNEIENELKSFNVKNSSLINRLIEYYAAIALSGEIFNEVIVNHPENKGRIQALNPIEITKKMMQDYMDQEPEKPEGERAIEALMDWYNGNKYKFNEPEPIAYNVNGETEYREQKVNFYGYDKGEIRYIFSNVAKDVLTKAGFNYNTILTSWKNDGYIIGKKDKNVYQKPLESEHQKILGKKNFTSVGIIKSKVQHLIVNSETNENNSNCIISDFCKDRLIIGGAIIEATLQEIHQDYTNWCKENSIIPMNILSFFTSFITINKNAVYQQTDINDMNSIFFVSVGLKERNVCIPKKLNLSDDTYVSA